MSPFILALRTPNPAWNPWQESSPTWALQWEGCPLSGLSALEGHSRDLSLLVVQTRAAPGRKGPCLEELRSVPVEAKTRQAATPSFSPVVHKMS